MGKETPTWEIALVKIFEHHKRRYGIRRLQVALRQKERRMSRQRLRTAMRRWGLHALQPKVYIPLDRLYTWAARLTGCTPASAIRPRIPLTDKFLKLLP